MKLTHCKETAIRDFIDKWVKEPTVYCNGCGTIYEEPPEGQKWTPCCENVLLGTNLMFLYWLIQENKMIRETRFNKYASNKDKTFRMKLSMTPRLMHDIEAYCVNTLHEPFLKDDQELNDFCRAFPQFKTCEVI